MLSHPQAACIGIRKMWYISIVVLLMNHIKLLFEVVFIREVLFSKKSVGVWCALCARMCVCVWHSILGHTSVSLRSSRACM